VICIDDKSSDESLRVIKEAASRDSRIRVLENKSNIGAGASRNRGLATARGQFVQFTDADDLLPENAIAGLYECATQDGVGIVRGNVTTVENREYKSVMPARHSVSFSEFQELWIPWWHPAFLFSRQMISNSGATYPPLRAGEDPVFLSQILSLDPKISTTGEVTYCWREQASGIAFRNTPDHLLDYIIHAKLVKNIWTRNHLTKCWTDAYKPCIIADIKTHAMKHKLTESQRSLVEHAIAELEQ